ncbi:hypothetical protein [Geotalea uraniireducens]|uniref:hypothetical protein n=1 Tax=Geotalea uraniireducens TaxID=351604 RepID=UPI0012EDADA0|nr:hypothetical protein [Geotalea uraniireducens]
MSHLYWHRGSRGSSSAPTAVLQGDNVAAFHGLAYDGAQYLASASIILGIDSQAGPVALNYAPSNIRFSTGVDKYKPERMRINYNGIVGIGTTAPALSGTGKLHMAGDTIRIDTPRTPASGSNCYQGEIAWDSGFVYVCTAANHWKRSALADY